MRRGLMAWLLASAVGTVVVMVPDQGPRVLSFSDAHGPSTWDLVGVVILLAGWACLLVPLVRARDLVPSATSFMFVFAVGLAVVVWSVTRDAGTWWVLGVCVAVGAQLIATGIAVFRPR